MAQRDPEKPSHLADRVWDVAFHALGAVIAWALVRGGVAVFG